MQSGSGSKNPPWARSNVNTNMTGINPQIMDPNAMMTQQSMMPFQQTQAMFNPMQAQGGMAMQMTGQMPMNQMAQGQMFPGNVVAYPTPRALNPGIYQNAQNNQSSTTEQRVFTGTITKTHNDFGFVDHDVFYQTSVCAKGIIPKINDRVLVEATFNPNMPFKWNATRVQVLPKAGACQKPPPTKSNSYNAVPPPSVARKAPPSRRDERPTRRDDRKRSRTRSRTRSRDRRDSRARRDSPPPKRSVVRQPSPIKYSVRVPRIPLDIQKVDVPALSQRYTNLYIPSDFFSACVRWGETFPPSTPLSLNNSCSYHIMSKEIENPNKNDTVLEPPDADYRFSAKVMLMSMPTLEALYQKCGLTKLEKEEKDKRPNNKTALHPTRLIKFLVGQKGKGGENFAIGGPWSPSLDGENPQTDPKVLVKTAIRTCKALTGIDLSSCTQWYRMVEFYYWREGSGNKSRLECVVLFLPDVWSAQPSRIEWSSVQDQYKAACDAAIRKLDGASSTVDKKQPSAATAAGAETAADAENCEIEATNVDDGTITIDENDEDKAEDIKLDLEAMNAEQLREELKKCDYKSKGLRSQIISRLSELSKTDKEDGGDVMDLEDDENLENNSHEDNTIQSQNEEEENKGDNIEDEKPNDEKQNEPQANSKKDEGEQKEIKKTDKEVEEEKKKIEKEKQNLKSRYEIPNSPHILVHPSATAKAGKFCCNVATLSWMLDYRVTDNKEHSFELFVFAELFNEMLMRDFGFYIYKTLYTLPEKTEEISDKSSDKAEKKDEKKTEEKKDEKKDDKDRKEDRRDEKRESRDDKRDSRKREVKDSHSDDEGTGSPNRRSRGVELPPDPYLLLSLVYFDTARGGTMTKKDLQNLFMSLGLRLSRSQIRSILEKVCIKELFNYKYLIGAIKDLSSGSSEVIQDLPLETTVSSDDVPSHITELEETIAAGNRLLLPVFKDSNEVGEEDGSKKTIDISDSGIVSYKNRVVDVGALVSSTSRWAAERAALERALESTRSALAAARRAALSRQQAQRGAQNQLSDLTASLAAARARVTTLTASSKIFHSTLKSIQSKVEAVINIKYEDDDVIEIVNGPSKDQRNQKEKTEKAKETIEEQTENRNDEETCINIDNIATDESQQKNAEVKEDIASSDNMEIDDKE